MSAAMAAGPIEVKTSLFSAVRLFCRVVVRTAPVLAVAGILLVPLSSGFAAVIGLGFKMLGDAYVAADRGAAVRAAAFLAGTSLAIWFTGNLGSLLRMTLTERVGHALQRHTSERTTAITGLEHLETSEFLDRLELINRGSRMLAYLASTVVHVLNAVAQLVVASLLLATVHPVLAALPLTCVPTVIASRLVQRRKRELEGRIAEAYRLSMELYWLTILSPSAKELLACNLGDEVGERRRRASLEVVELQCRAEVTGATYLGVGTLLASLGYVAAIAFVGVLADRGDATLGELLLTVALAGQFAALVTQLLTHVSDAADMLRTAERIAWVDAYAGAQEAGRPTAAPPPQLTTGIWLDGVGYRYPGVDTWALRDVHLDIPAGSVLALVGENGAGKSTLVKLLCGLYTPTAGSIHVDGVPLRHIDPIAWSSSTSASFQDFARLELVLHESVGVGDLSRVDDRAAIRTSLDDADAGALVDGSPMGLDQQLGSQWPDGTELSGGQWQKVALARGLLRSEPLLLVLDEPTASLDAASEHALYERFAAAAAEHSSRGGVTILVTHRFSTVAMADHIAVLEDGVISEHGAHAELMERGGRYRELFMIQADVYA